MGGLYGNRGDLASLPGMSLTHEWSRLHPTPPSFPSLPAWPPKSDLERERELRERDKDRERDREREQREPELEREMRIRPGASRDFHCDSSRER